MPRLPTQPLLASGTSVQRCVGPSLGIGLNTGSEQEPVDSIISRSSYVKVIADELPIIYLRNFRTRPSWDCNTKKPFPLIVIPSSALATQAQACLARGRWRPPRRGNGAVRAAAVGGSCSPAGVIYEGPRSKVWRPLSAVSETPDAPPG
jgi:hypothetical protein